MNCPVCRKEMVEKDFGGVKVNVCANGCKGIWFDWMELRRLDEKNEGLGSALKEALEHPRTNDANRAQINCPKCGIPMHAHKYESSKEVNIDECYNCSGFFLDSGELSAVRDSFMSEEEEEQYAQKLLNNMSDFQKAKQDLAKDKQREETFHRYTRFLRLSYYVEGR